MSTVIVKGYEVSSRKIKDSFTRRATQFKNKIIFALRKLGVHEDDVEVVFETFSIKKAPASVSFYFEGYHLYFSYKLAERFVDNLNIVMQVIEREVESVLSKEKTVDQFIEDFSEDYDIEEQRQQARALLGVAEDELDFSVIHKKYKQLAKQCHPDMDGGDVEKFKALNRAHKMLKRELQ